MYLLEEAIVYATGKHRGKKRKIKATPYILHPIEVAQIISTMTDDEEVISAGVLHDVVEDTDGTLDEIREMFGERVAELVASETEDKYEGEDKAATWKKRKDESLWQLKNCKDTGVKMLWLADKLANIRNIAGFYNEHGEGIWDTFNQKDPEMHRWYYKTVAEYVEFDLNRTGAYKEFINHINFIWPGTFGSEKERYRRYKEVSIEGCPLIGRGAKGDVYRYDDELIIKVYNDNNTYQDVEREIAISRRAFVMGLPTAISFGIVSVGKGYGAMFELVNSHTVSWYISSDPERVDEYAKIMADVAHVIHDTESDSDDFPDSSETLRDWVKKGVGRDDEELESQLLALIDAMPATDHMVHGDLHSGNVMLQNGEPILVDLDRMATGHPIVDLSLMYMSYIAFPEEKPGEVERFMGFSCETAHKLYRSFMGYYLDTEDEEEIRRVSNKAAILCYSRILRQIGKKDRLSDKDIASKQRILEKIRELSLEVDSLMI